MLLTKDCSLDTSSCIRSTYDHLYTTVICGFIANLQLVPLKIHETVRTPTLTRSKSEDETSNSRWKYQKDDPPTVIPSQCHGRSALYEGDDPPTA